MNNKSGKDAVSASGSLEKVKSAWNTLKTETGVDPVDQAPVHKFYTRIRRFSLFSRRRSRSLVNRILGILMIWGVLVYALAIAGIWWGSNQVIEDNFSHQARDWVSKLDELGTPLYATEDARLFQSIEDHVSRFPELSYLRYYEAETNKVVAEYRSIKLENNNIPRLTPTQIERLRLNIEANAPMFIHTVDSELSLIQAAAPIVIRSIKSDGLMDFNLELDLDQEQIESYKIIGFLELGLDFGIYRQQLIKNISLGSLFIAILFLVSSVIGRLIIKRSLSQLTNLRKPLAKLASGDIDVYVDNEGDEEIVAIANALNTTISALKSRDEKLRRMANYDALTGLLNKHNFNIQLRYELERVVAEDDCSALLFIDLDQFKYVNDTLGHAAGDHLLSQVADLFKKRIRQDDVLARFGGDEFTIIAKSVTEKDAEAIANSIIKQMQNFIFIENEQAFNIYCSIGVVMIKGEQFSAEEVFSQADMACFQAKSDGRNRYHIFDAREQEEIKKDVDIGWSKRINDAIKNDYFVLYFQPIVSLRDDAREHYEVLLRLNVEDDVLSPSAFLPAAERLGVAIDIDYWVVRNAIRKISEFQADGRDVVLSINLSGRIFEAPDLIDRVQRYIKQYDVNSELIIFEITEQTAVRQIERASERINELVELGCRFALDDFGVGFSSFNYLKHLPVDILKIDGDFIADMTKDPVDQAMVKSMIQIAATLGKQTVAEYVQDAATMEMLKQFGADYIQGYYLGEPTTAINSQYYADAVDKITTNVIKL
ncbi:MAG: EAL domain-containing protein [Gammaproteobacteria bacterium]|nr:EAL domain-containing protein [Gammaproteobacteria bacterium]